MTMALVLLLLFPILNIERSLAADAQAIPPSVLNEIANDLEDLNQVVVRAGQGKPANTPAPWIYGIEITKEKAEIKAGASKDASKVLEVKRGQSFKVIDKAGPWYAIEKEGKTLGWIDASSSKPISGVLLTDEKSSSEGSELVFKSLTERAARLRDKYRDNPYVTVKGFSVHLGIPPSVDVSFEFK